MERHGQWIAEKPTGYVDLAAMITVIPEAYADNLHPFPDEATAAVQAELDLANQQLGDAGEKINDLMGENDKLKSELSCLMSELSN